MEYSPEFIHYLLLASIPIGMITCFWGYKAFKIVLGVLGFLGGLTAGYLLSVSFGIQGILVWILLIVGGVIGAGLSVALYYFGIFMAGAVSGGLLGSLLSSQVKVEPLILILACGLALGIFALLIQKPIIVFSTALVGAWLAVSGGAYFFGGFDIFRFFQDPSSAWDKFPNREVVLIGWLLLSGIGMLVQFRSKSRSKVESKPKKKDD